MTVTQNFLRTTKSLKTVQVHDVIHNRWEQANTNRDSNSLQNRERSTQSARLQTREMVNPPKTQKLSKEKNPKGLNVCDDGVMWLGNERRIKVSMKWLNVI